MKKSVLLLLPLLILLVDAGCKKKKNDPVDGGSFAFQGISYKLDKCFLYLEETLQNSYEMDLWMLTNGIFYNPSSQSGSSGQGNYVNFMLHTTDLTLQEGDYYYSPNGEPMTWCESEFGIDYNWDSGTGYFEWIENAIINVSKENGIYTFTFAGYTEGGNYLEGVYTGSVQAP